MPLTKPCRMWVGRTRLLHTGAMQPKQTMSSSIAAVMADGRQLQLSPALEPVCSAQTFEPCMHMMRAGGDDLPALAGGSPQG